MWARICRFYLDAKQVKHFHCIHTIKIENIFFTNINQFVPNIPTISTWYNKILIKISDYSTLSKEHLDDYVCALVSEIFGTSP